MPGPHDSHESPPPTEFRVPERIVLKYADELEVPDAPSEGSAGGLALPGWKDVQESFALVRNRRLLRRPVEDIRRLVARAAVRDKRYLTRRPQNFVVVDVPEGVSPKALGEFARSASGGAIESWYILPQPELPPQGGTVVEGDLQLYLDPANQGGVDARYAWTQPGGRGERQALYDVEWGWWLEHDDLAARQATLVGGCDYTYFHHGTAMLGIAVAVENGTGCIGIAPGVERVRCAGSWRTMDQTDNDIADAIWDVIQDVVTEGLSGSVLLLEEQTSRFGHTRIPAEAIPGVFEMVRLATALGIVVVAPAGNGGVDLDSVVDPETGRHVFVPDGTGDDDSGAILVGSASSAMPHTPRLDSCSGTRVNCFGWGDSVYAPTTDYYRLTKNQYGAVVGQTSSAAAMIAGVALAAQGIASAGGRVLDSREMRAVLSNAALGSAVGSGSMPDLRKIIDSGALRASPI